MFRKLMNTDNDVLLTVLRLVLGIVFFAHGAQKLLGWFGGAGFTGTADIKAEMSGNIHRCGTYQYIRRAIHCAAGL